MEEKPFIYQKLEALFRKHSADGTTPKKLIEAGIAREFRLCREDVKRMIEEMNLEQKEMINRKRVKREERVNYSQATRDSYLNDLKSSR